MSKHLAGPGFRAFVVLGLAAILLLGWWLTHKPEEKIASAFPQELKNTQTDKLDAISEPGSTPSHEASQESDSLDQNRSFVAMYVLHGRVLDDDGNPIRGARVTVTCLLPEMYSSGTAWDGLDHLHASSLALDMLSIEGGVFSADLSKCNYASHSHVIWAVCAGYQADCALVNSGKSTTEPIVITLRSDEGYSVQVRDVRGEPVQGAIVRLVATKLDLQEISTSDATAVCRALFLEWSTDEKGEVPEWVPGVSGSLALLARKDNLVASPYLSSADTRKETVVLQLHGALPVDGVVTSSEGELKLTDAVVQVYSDEAGILRLLDQVRVGDDGNWTARGVPDTSRQGLMFRLVGEGIATDQVTLDEPNRGAGYFVSLSARPEVELPILVLDKAGNPIANASITTEWSANPVSIAINGRSDSSGNVVIKGGNSGTVWVSAEARGYAKVVIGPVVITPPVVEPFKVVLPLGGRVTGRVLHDGRGVPEFEIVWWTAAATQGAGNTVAPFSNREDGAFELEYLPDESIYILASSQEYPRSPTVRVDPDSEKDHDIVLELPSALNVRGQVVDAESDQPLSTAIVQLYSNYGANYVSAWGPSIPVSTEGRFEATGFAEGQNRYVVEAPGYARMLGDTWVRAPGPIELGRLPLFRSQVLTVALVGSLPSDLSGFSASAIASRFYNERRFGPDGTVAFEDMGPGRTRVYVSMPDGSATWHMVDLLPGEKWIVEVPIEGGPTLEVQVEPEGNAPLPKRLSAAATVLLENGYHNRSTPVDDEGKAHIQGIPIGDVAVDIWNEAGERIAAAVGRQSSEGGSVVVRLGGRSQTFRVVDGNGDAVSNAEVHLYLSGGKAGWYDYGYSDDQGLYVARGFPAERVFAGIIHPDYGKVFGIPVELATAPDPLELRFDTEATLAVQLVENGQPQPGVQVRVLGGSGTYIVGWVNSDAEGIVRVPHLGAGSYDLTVLHPGYWQHGASIAASDASTPTPFEVYHLGTLRVTVKSIGGAPVSGFSVELEHARLGSVAEWIAADRVQVPGGSLSTGSDGSLVINGMPRGNYTWSAALADGTPLSGEITVTQGQVAELEILVP